MNRLKELRKEKKLSQKAIAEIFEVPTRTWQRWENGESQIKPDKAQALADYFGVSVGYVLGYEQQPRDEEMEEYFKEEFKAIYESLQPSIESYERSMIFVKKAINTIIKDMERDKFYKDGVISTLKLVEEMLTNQEVTLNLIVDHAILKTRLEIIKDTHNKD